MKKYNKEVFEQISKLQWVLDIAQEYEGICLFNEDTLTIDYYDEFGQCSVHLGFDDQFAIRDSFGNWRQTSAEECIELREGKLKGSMKLM
ncbi:hypothetical protein [Xenorhabdus bovienii]|uniref:hypothetical protein n=1 Tax=Xenorhabdus bovienii TaxID=40576 RepID=UPI003DA4022A